MVKNVGWWVLHSLTQSNSCQHLMVLVRQSAELYFFKCEIFAIVKIWIMILKGLSVLGKDIQEFVLFQNLQWIYATEPKLRTNKTNNLHQML